MAKVEVFHFPNAENFFLEIHFREKKCVIFCLYNPHNQTIFSYITSMGKAVDSLSLKYVNLLIIGDFNAQASVTFVKDFNDIYSFEYLIKELTCYKSPINPKCIDLMLTNRQHSFQNFGVIGTELSDFHKMTVAVLRPYFVKVELKIIMYRDYKHFK